MFRVKICGVTEPGAATAIATLGAGAIGLNFYRESPRSIDPDRAAEIVRDVPPTVLKVGVFVNARIEEIWRIVDRVGLDLVQLHGDEPPELLADLSPIRVVRAFRCGAAGLGPVFDYLDQCSRLDCSPAMVLIESHQAGQYGGTGRKADWNLLACYSQRAGLPPLILAGGLTPINVAEAIRCVGPVAVDTASGVEIRPGIKDLDSVRAFVAAAREAFALASPAV